jgi:hypothetical protein
LKNNLTPGQDQVLSYFEKIIAEKELHKIVPACVCLDDIEFKNKEVGFKIMDELVKSDKIYIRPIINNSCKTWYLKK